MPVPSHEGRAVGQQPGSVAGVRGGGAAEARARPNVEVNRRAEGTSELNRRLGAVGKGAEALERCGPRRRLWPRPCRKASSMCLCCSTKAEQQASNRVASPEPEGVENRNPAKA